MKPLQLEKSFALQITLDSEHGFLELISNYSGMDPDAIYVNASHLPQIIKYLKACLKEMESRQGA
jgi:hypothetical protein